MFAPLLLVLLLVLGRMAFAEPTVGAALLGWPPARPFNYYTERLAPCGSPLGAGERVELPTKNAHVAFFAERDVGLNLAISYSQDPTSQDDFETLKYALPPGHINLVSGITCVILGSPISGAVHGRNATLQFKYLSNYDSPEEYRYRYSCADVTFSDTANSYNGDICRNKTRPVAYDRLYGPFLGSEDEEHDEEPRPPDRGNYVEVEVERPPFPGWAIALIAVGASFFCSIVYLVIYRVCIVPWKKRKPAQTTGRWVPPPV